jgi:hypothetical protein
LARLPGGNSEGLPLALSVILFGLWEAGVDGEGRKPFSVDLARRDPFSDAFAHCGSRPHFSPPVSRAQAQLYGVTLELASAPTLSIGPSYILLLTLALLCSPLATPVLLSLGSTSRFTMIDPKWTGTENDRHDMKKLKLEQVLRVSVSITRWPR